MAGMTQAKAQAAYDAAEAAYLRAVNYQSYSIAGRSISRQRIEDLRNDMEYWDNKLKEFTEDSSGLIISQVAPSDV